MTPDLVNATFELAAAAFLALHVRRVWTDKDVAGASIIACVFFITWGCWNAGYFYLSVGLWWSFWGCIPVLVMNTAWLVGLWKYRRRPEHPNMIFDACPQGCDHRWGKSGTYCGYSNAQQCYWCGATRGALDPTQDPTCIACRCYSVTYYGATCEKCLRKGIITRATDLPSPNIVTLAEHDWEIQWGCQTCRKCGMMRGRHGWESGPVLGCKEKANEREPSSGLERDDPQGTQPE